MSKPNFSAIEIEKVLSTEAPAASDEKFMTNEGIEIKDIYTKDDIKDVKHLHDVAGIAPNTRGTIPYYVCCTSLDSSSVCRFLYC
ncbi:hypothetical protein LSPH24S_04902 [Lysinibacillus sphaericus]